MVLQIILILKQHYFDLSAFRLRLLALMASLPAPVLGPVERPPCSLQRPFLALSVDLFHTGGAWQGVPLRVLALHVPLFFLGVLGSLQNHENLMLPFRSI